MTLEVVGANHKTSPLEARERLAVSPEDLPEALKKLARACGLSELAILSTCNRVEYYFVREGGGEHPGHTLAAAAGLSREAARKSVYHMRGVDAARHLFSVAAGLDSMALGETEVLAQCKRAYEAARAAGTTAQTLNCLFQRAFAAAKRVHSLTGLGKGRTSVGSVSAALVKREIGGLAGKTVLVIGAGAMAENAIAHVAALGGPHVVVTSRSRARARALSARFHGEVVGLDCMEPALAAAHVVITSASGKKFLVTRATLARARKRASHRMVILDLSVPRKVDPAAASLEGVSLFNIDDLKTLADKGRSARYAGIADAAKIIAQEASVCNARLAEGRVVGVVKQLQAQAACRQEREVKAALENLARGGSPEDQIRALAKRLTAQFLHEPLRALKAASRDGDRAEQLARAARELHGIREDGRSEE